MSAFTLDITLEEGEQFVLPMEYRPDGDLADLTGYSARVAIRTTLGATTALLDFDDQESADGTIDLGGPAGTVTLRIEGPKTAEVCAALDGHFGYWDLFLYHPWGTPDKMVKGRVLGYRSAVRGEPSETVLYGGDSTT
jgi:hypothetical protein